MAAHVYRGGRWRTVSDHNSDGYLPDGTAADPADVSPVPAGSADEVVAWIDGDTDRARRALLAEHQRRGTPRRRVARAVADLLTVDG